MIFVESSDSLLTSFIDSLNNEFPMKYLGPLHYCLSVEAHFDSSAKKMLRTHNKYMLDLIRKHNMIGCKPCKTPVDQGKRDSAFDGYILQDASAYKSLIGGMQYLTLIRPDITDAVHYVSQFMHCPTYIHIHLAKRILIYLKGSLGQGLTRDSSWDGYPDTRKCTFGYCVFVKGNLVSWVSRNNKLFLDLLLKINIGVLQMLLLRFYGSVICLKKFMSDYLLCERFHVTT
ncbi:uncharacterized protein LOC113291795 [Papaver somniferum]|uniref:uncharacterized protein LOC113291795 n=1 Tax=Papaver somniferum TaxID=3469 RepID=UPI000E6F9D11|nr:uncharacterized protein LOC113291795 [Papaver somniferum]